MSNNMTPLPDRTPEQTLRWHLDHLQMIRPKDPKTAGEKIAAARIGDQITACREAIKAERSKTAA